MMFGKISAIATLLLSAATPALAGSPSAVSVSPWSGVQFAQTTPTQAQPPRKADGGDYVGNPQLANPVKR